MAGRRGWRLLGAAMLLIGFTSLGAAQGAPGSSVEGRGVTLQDYRLTALEGQLRDLQAEHRWLAGVLVTNLVAIVVGVISNRVGRAAPGRSWSP